MAKDTVILSPEYNGFGRREALAVGATITTGTVCKYVDGGVSNAVAADNTAALIKLIAVENIATRRGN